jgi:hypothetical protein
LPQCRKRRNEDIALLKIMLANTINFLNLCTMQCFNLPYEGFDLLKHGSATKFKIQKVPGNTQANHSKKCGRGVGEG